MERGLSGDLKKESVENAQEKDKLLNNLFTYKYSGELSYEIFCEKIKLKAEKILIKKGIIEEFRIDENNSEIVRQLYLYFIGNQECKWNIHAGLIFAGKIGCGKTLLMLSYILLSNELLQKQISIYHSNDLVEFIKSKGISEIDKRPLFIDELGREITEVKDYGTASKPIIELLSKRYENGARTFATTNFFIGALVKKYDNFIGSRLLEMCNYIQIPGESRRKENLFND